MLLNNKNKIPIPPNNNMVINNSIRVWTQILLIYFIKISSYYRQIGKCSQSCSSDQIQKFNGLMRYQIIPLPISEDTMQELMGCPTTVPITRYNKHCNIHP